jgi:uncharacterized protein YkwD
MPHLPTRARLVARHLAGALAALVLAPILAVAAPSPAAAIPVPAGTPVQLTVEEQAHLDLLNRYRADRGLATLEVDARVQVDARQWAATMAGSRTLAHDPGLRDDCFAASITCAGWSENVGQAADHARVFQLFAGSPGHAANMATDPGGTVRVGIGVLRSGGTTWVVQRFMRCDCDNAGLALKLNTQRRHALAFAEALHSDFLGTRGSAASLDAVAAPMAYGVSRQVVTERLAYSDAWVGAMVDRFYRSTLGRTPDAAGRDHWIQEIRSGRSPAEVAAHFFASEEYFRSTGGSTDGWVRDLYEQLLGRAGDAEGVRHWVDRAHRSGREPVAIEFYQSAESRSVRVEGLYDLLLGRNPDDHGLVYWIFRLADGQDVRLAVDLATSEEYLGRAIQRFA